MLPAMSMGCMSNAPLTNFLALGENLRQTHNLDEEIGRRGRSRFIPAFSGLVIDKTAVVSAVGPVRVATSEHAFFSADSIAIRCTWRFGANVVKPNRIGKFTLIGPPGKDQPRRAFLRRAGTCTRTTHPKDPQGALTPQGHPTPPLPA
jgi:hypothetical protein